MEPFPDNLTIDSGPCNPQTKIKNPKKKIACLSDPGPPGDILMIWLWPINWFFARNRTENPHTAQIVQNASNKSSKITKFREHQQIRFLFWHEQGRRKGPQDAFKCISKWLWKKLREYQIGRAPQISKMSKAPRRELNFHISYGSHIWTNKLST